MRGVIGFAKAHLHEHDVATRVVHACRDGNDCIRQFVAIVKGNPEVHHGKTEVPAVLSRRCDDRSDSIFRTSAPIALATRSH